MKIISQEIEAQKKRFGKIFIISVLSVFAFFISLVLLMPKIQEKAIVPKEILIIIFVSLSFVTYVISKTKFDFWPIYRIMTLVMAVVIFYLSLYIHHVSYVIFLFYIPIVLMILMLYDLRFAVISALCFMGLVFFVQDIASFLNINQIVINSEKSARIIKIQDYVIMVSTIYFSFLILYFHNAITKIQANYADKDGGSAEYLISNHNNEIYTVDNADASGRLESLYLEIKNHFEIKKPFRNPGFTITMLATELETNSTYIYKALSTKSDQNFRDLVNEYRINQVLTALKNNDHKIFTIEHIYKEAGFLQQSTFNRVFKKSTGQTPSQYIENISNPSIQ